ncbi:hypothetical protein FKW77_003721 [Venturia effusa]|uniref:Uncharacterized protein n=1 Tax=Venturia effusa TaxID=50376 RepID=A0A517LJY4_9PEZI|nr:hypothetical protein FKW77_003721 [Venturia effusa]
MNSASTRSRIKVNVKTQADRMKLHVTSSEQQDGEPTSKRQKISQSSHEQKEIGDVKSGTKGLQNISDPISVKILDVRLSPKQIMIDSIDAYAEDKFKIVKLREAKIQAENKAKALEKRVQELETHNQNLEAKLRHRKSTRAITAKNGDPEASKTGEGDVEDTKAEVKKPEERVEELENQVMELEAELDEAQDTIFNMDDNAKWTPKQDSEIRERLCKLETKIRRYCERHAGEFSNRTSAKARFPIPDDIAEEIWLRSNNRSTEGLTDEILCRTEPWLILSAWMNCFFYRKIFGNPFFFTNELLKSVQEEFEKTDFASAIHVLLLDLRKSDDKDGLKLRCDLMRALYPRDTSEKAKDRRKKTLTAVRKACHGLTHEFLKGPASRKTLPPPDKESVQVLLEIVTSLGILSLDISTQRSAVILKRKNQLPRVFSLSDSLLEPNSLHEKELTIDEEQLENRHIMLVTCPGLVLRGSSDGTDKESLRILRKAIVWMGEPEDEGDN